jgi:3-keto-L-gulonate-6-phosphate decarboxylase
MCQVTVLSNVSEEVDDKILRRVVGVHAVRDQRAEELNDIFWETVGHLKEVCKARTVAAVADGASVNRLMQARAYPAAVAS